jgi:hypothetical protein
MTVFVAFINVFAFKTITLESVFTFTIVISRQRADTSGVAMAVII